MPVLSIEEIPRKRKFVRHSSDSEEDEIYEGAEHYGDDEAIAEFFGEEIDSPHIAPEFESLVLEASASGVSQEVDDESQPQHITWEEQTPLQQYQTAIGICVDLTIQYSQSLMASETQENFPDIIQSPSGGWMLSSQGNVTEQTNTSPKETEADVNSRTDHNDTPSKSEESSDEENDDCMGDENVS